MKKILAFASVLIVAGGPWVGLGPAQADHPADTQAEDTQAADVPLDDQAERFAKFQETLNGATLDGQYTIQSMRKLPEGNFWLCQVRIQIDGDKYAGTWSHDQVGGHLFGTIKRKELNDE